MLKNKILARIKNLMRPVYDSLRWRIRALVGSLQLLKTRKLIRSEEGVESRELSNLDLDRVVLWEEPNRAETQPLHIAKSGERYSTITGVWWLDERYFIASHRSGLAIAVFDISDVEAPVWKAEVEHIADDIAAKKISEDKWEICLSGCWDCIYSTYTLTRIKEGDSSFKMEAKTVIQHHKKDFCHGVAYDSDGRLCYTIHTGKDPRVQIGDWTSRIPKPWGARDICYDPELNRYIVVAVSSNPRRSAYGSAKTSLWTCSANSKTWVCLAVFNNLHSDCLDTKDALIWIPDQLVNRLLSVNGVTGAIEKIYLGECFDFPHGLHISPAGKIAVTNYGSSSLALLDL